jgi:hypothetical protein
METTETTPNNTAKDVNKEIDNLLSGYTETPIINEPVETGKKRGRKPKDQSPPVNEEPKIMDSAAISGSLLILLVDLLIPNILVFANNKFSKKKMKASKLQMTAQQRSELEPLADAVAKQMALKSSPLAVLIISMVGIYGVNLIMQKGE